jgi:uncharacterized protein YkwD
MKKTLINVLFLSILLLVASLVFFNPLGKIENPEEEITFQEITVSQIIELTNVERFNNDLVQFSENQLLNQVALIKVDDMINNNYFAHESPSGNEAGDLAKLVGYSFIAIGENLAKGGFVDAQDLVNGWMNSPAHRDNILHSGYREIGVAIKKNNEIWIAVQIFGLPLSICPAVEDSLSKEIEAKQKTIDSLAQEIRKLKGSQEIEKYNQLVTEHNGLLRNLEILINEYNRQIESANQCIESYGF